MDKADKIRNFAIIAHVDHGKSTLADRIMETTGTVAAGHRSQLLDSHPISRERGITIRLAPVTMHYHYQDSDYILNLIDTPGHVDFSYEVERTLSACEGAILLVDATQGVQAQTLSHLHKAQKLGLTIIPVLNKIDLPNALVAETQLQLEELLGPDHPEILRISAKTGEGVKEVLDTIIKEVPPPCGEINRPARALIFSSQFEKERGVIAFIRVVDGTLHLSDRVSLLATGQTAKIFEIGRFVPAMQPAGALTVGEVGYLITNLKDPELVKTGDTITNEETKTLTVSPLPGYREAKPMVFVSLFPVDQNDYGNLEDSLNKLKLNDAAISFVPTSSKALGRGYRCGFLGHLHAEISQERLSTDYGLEIIATTPTVEFQNDPAGGLLEPWVEATIIAPTEYIGAVIEICESRRGKMTTMTYHGRSATLIYELPLAEIITDFFDELKSKSSGFASLDYELLNYRPFDSVQMDILINHEVVDAFSQILEKSRAESYGKKLTEKLSQIIPRQQIPVIIQAAINGQIIARGDIAAFRKDVTAKLYGGDRTRKDKLLEAQKKGKKKMKQIGKITIPGDTFLNVFKN